MTEPVYERHAPASALPIYVQISEVLIREIASGQLADGMRLPPERELAKQHFTTVRTLRKALDILQEKGLIERIQGSGNYVRHGHAADSVYAMFRLELHTGAGLPTAQILSLDPMTKPDDLPAFGASAEATRIRRLRFLDRVPIAVEEIWLDASAGLVSREKLSDSLYRYYKMELGFWITNAADFVGVGEVPDWAPQGFPRKPGACVGFIERFSDAASHGTVEYSRTWFDHTTARYVQRLK